MRREIPKSEILKSALSLFSSKGYSETKMSTIASNVGLSVGALYLRFKNKEDLCRELIADQTRNFVRLTDELINSDTDPLEKLEAYIDMNLELAIKKRQLLSVFIREYELAFLQPLKRNFYKTQHGIIRDILKDGVKKGVFVQMDTAEMASIIFASIRGAVILKLVFGIGNTKTHSKSLYKLITDGIRKDSR